MRRFESWAVVLLALLARVLPHASKVILDDGVLLGHSGDTYYHLRRIQLATKYWPVVPDHDAWLSYPDGGYSAWPPLFDFAPATFAHLTGMNPNWVAVLWPPVLGALSVLPLMALVRRMQGDRAALIAGLCFALLPANVAVSAIGEVDHHVAETLLQVWVYAWLLDDLQALERGASLALPKSVRLGVLIGTCMLTWMGSVLFLVVPAAIVCLWMLPPRSAYAARAASRHMAIAYTLGALLATPYGLLNVARGRSPTGFYFISLLQPAMCLAFGAAVLGFLWMAAPVRERALGAAARRLGLILIGLTLPLLIPGLRDGLLGGLSFVGRRGDAFAIEIAESVPLLSTAHTRTFAFQHVGHGHYLLPLFIALLALQALRSDRRRADVLVPLVWSAHVTLLAATQARFLYYAAAVVSILPVALAHAAASRRVWVTRLLGLLGFAAIAPALLYYWSPLWSRNPHDVVPLAQIDPDRLALLEQLTRITPSAGDPDDPYTRPAYCVFTPWGLGHDTVVLGRRPVVANNYGPYLEGGSYEDSRRFYKELRDERDAAALLTRRGCRYLITTSGGSPASTAKQLFASRLHALDGSDSTAGPGSARLRLIAETPARDADPGSATHKLFAFVPGAELRFPARTEGHVVTEVSVGPRRFVYARRLEHGRVHVSYPGNYRVMRGASELGVVPVSEEAVTRGKTLEIGAR